MKKIVVLCTQSNQDEMLESRSLKVLHLDKIKEANNEKLELVSKIDDIEKTKIILSSLKIMNSKMIRLTI